MPYTGSLPAASIHGTWSENLELRDVEDDELIDLTGVTEITLKLRDPLTRHDDMTLSLSDGNIEVVSPGVIQWRAEVGTMGTLSTKLYEVILILEDEDDTVPIVLGTISIIE